MQYSLNENVFVYDKGGFSGRNIKVPKSFYKSRGGRHFYGTENEIWASFGPVGNTEKKNCFQGGKKFLIFKS